MLRTIPNRCFGINWGQFLVLTKRVAQRNRTKTLETRHSMTKQQSTTELRSCCMLFYVVFSVSREVVDWSDWSAWINAFRRHHGKTQSQKSRQRWQRLHENSLPKLPQQISCPEQVKWTCGQGTVLVTLVKLISKGCEECLTCHGSRTQTRNDSVPR